MGKQIQLLNIKIDVLSFDEAIDRIDELINKRKSSYVVTPNIDHIVMLENDKEFKKTYDNADLVLVDGKPLVWIAKLLKKEKIEKISGSDLFPKVCELASKKGYSMFLFGAKEGVAAKAAKNLMDKYQGLKIVGTYSPKPSFEKNKVELIASIQAIKDKKPDILIVGLGAPKQEKFIYNNLDILNVPISLGLGASIDFEAGNVKRAPKWMQNVGLEWLYRIIQEPGRLTKRYVIDAIKIIPIIVKYRRR